MTPRARKVAGAIFDFGMFFIILAMIGAMFVVEVTRGPRERLKAMVAKCR